jgi:GNAT superfamily N-acetyltransferase
MITRPFEKRDTEAVHDLYSHAIVSLTPALVRKGLVPPKGKIGVVLVLAIGALSHWFAFSTPALGLAALALLGSIYVVCGTFLINSVRLALRGDTAEIIPSYRKKGGEFWVVCVPAADGWEEWKDLPYRENSYISGDQRVVGMAGCDVSGSAEGGCELRRLAVHPEFQRRGVAAGLVDAAEGFASKEGHKRLVAGCSTVQAAAIALLERRGFQALREEPAHSAAEGALLGTRRRWLAKALE